MSEIAARIIPSPAVPAAMIARIVDVLDPEQVWLFGSRARGEARTDSDWDLMAILPDGAPEQDLEIASVWKRLRDLRLQRVELFTMTVASSTHGKARSAPSRRSSHRPACSYMTADPPKPDPRVIAAYLDDVVAS